jgi:RNase adapter protein RapZ
MKKRIAIITGLSGSGKSTVARTLEDIGYFCVDNLPVDLVPKLIELTESATSNIALLALVIDVRQRQFFPRTSEILGSLDPMGSTIEIIFLDARDDVLVRRYSETRRQHPLALTGSVLDGINRERQELIEIKGRADWVIDTSDLSVHQLREEIRKIFEASTSGMLKIVVNSFGFGKGLPVEADLVFDVRFLPNPYFEEGLRDKDGRDSQVSRWVLGHSTTQEFLRKIEELAIFLLPLYIREGKQYLTVAIGCTGGRHRSVVIAEYLGNFLVSKGYKGVEIRHRELNR